MRFLGAPTDRLIGIAPVFVRQIVGSIMLAHGLQKLSQGPATFGATFLQPRGVPYADVMAYVVTYTELTAGALLIVGLLSRLAALALLIELATAITLVKSHVGLIAPPASGAGAELDLALVAGFLTILLLGPGTLSLDYLLRVERRGRRRDPATA
jgi:putative oxidoreductase